MVYRASSKAKAQEPDSGIDVESQASSKAKAREPDLGIGAQEQTLTGDNFFCMLSSLSFPSSPELVPVLWELACMLISRFRCQTPHCHIFTLKGLLLPFVIGVGD
jgi:hypothetical protein